MEENLRRIHRSVFDCLLYSALALSHYANKKLMLSSSSSGSIRISSQLCPQRNSRNYKSQVLPFHRHKIPLKAWRWKRTKQVCITGGGSEKNSLRVTVAMETHRAVSWTTVWICSREEMDLCVDGALHVTQTSPW